MKALTFSQFGGPEVLNYQEIPLAEIGPTEVLVEMKAIGLNYADIYRRKGNYYLDGNPPYIAGYEGAGIVSKSNSEDFRPGDYVAFADVPFSNAEYVAVPKEKLILLPEGVDFQVAASLLLQGLTAQYLTNNSYNVSEGDVVLIHAASGGVGQLLTQLSKMKGATVIGLSRTEAKFKTIYENKADHVVKLDDDWQNEVLEITNGMGVDVVYDSVGSTLAESIAVTRVRGSIIFFGMSGGDPDPIDPRTLAEGSKKLIGGDLWSYLNSSEERNKRAGELFALVKKGDLKLKKPVTFRLDEGRKAHAFLEEGKSQGKVLLIP